MKKRKKKLENLYRYNKTVIKYDKKTALAYD